MALQSKLTLAAFIFLVLTGCSNIVPETHSVLVLYDVTGSTHSALPPANKVVADISKIYNISDDDAIEDFVYDGFDIGMTFFDELSGDRIKHKRFKPAKGSTATVNPIKRKRLLQKYLQSVKNMIARTLQNTPVNRQKSKIYSKLCKSLGKISESDADTRHVVIYTDLLENSELANFYDGATLNQAAAEPVAFARRHFISSCALPDLDGVIVHLYPYRSASTDTRINLAERFWVALLEDAGAEVEVDP